MPPIKGLEDIPVARARGLQWTLSDILAIIENDMNGGATTGTTAKDFHAFGKSITSLVLAHYGLMGQRIREAYAGRKVHLRDRVTGEITLDDDELTSTVDMARDVAELLSAAEYAPLSKRLYELALDTDYNFALPTGTDWAKLDAETLPQVYAALREQRCGLFQGADAAEYGSEETLGHFAKHVLVLVRGIHVEEKTDYFFREKADMITAALWHRLARTAGFIAGKVTLSADRGHRVRSFIDAFLEAPTSKKDPPHEADLRMERQLRRGTFAADHHEHGSREEVAEGEQVAARRTATVHRKSVRDAVLEKGLFWGYFSMATALEPCFDHVVVMYRDTADAPREKERLRDMRKQLKDHSEGASGKHRGTMTKTTEAATAAAVEAQHAEIFGAPWRIAAYRDIPFGDLEVVLPYKKMGMLPTDVVRMAISVFGLLIAFKVTIGDIVGSIADVWTPMTTASVSVTGAVEYVQDTTTAFMRFFVIASLVVAIVSKLVTVVTSYMNTIAAYEKQIQSWLLDKRVASDRDVVTKLIDEVQVQEAAEILLGYYALSKRGGDGMAVDEVRASVEGLMAAATTATVAGEEEAVEQPEFDAADALWKLESLGLAKRVDDAGVTRYAVAQTMAEFHQNYPMRHLSGLTLRKREFVPSDVRGGDPAAPLVEASRSGASFSQKRQPQLASSASDTHAVVSRG